MNYSMYTDQGNEIASAICTLSRLSGLDWHSTLSLMRFISEQRPDAAGDLMDTAVREVMYHRLGFDTDFYS